jgi:hypothetical protein
MAILAGRNLLWGMDGPQYSDGTGQRKPLLGCTKPRFRHGFAMLGGKIGPMKQPPPALPRTRPWLALLALGLILLSWPNAMAGDRALPPPHERIEDSGEIRQLLTDSTLYGRYVGGQRWSEYHSPDGRTAYRENNCTYQGHWWIDAGLVCFRYEAFNEARPACFRLYRNKDQLDFYQQRLDGDWVLNAYTNDRRKGNPENLPLQGQACVGV